MPRGKLVSKSEVQLSAGPKAKRGRPPKQKVAEKAARKQSIAKVAAARRPVGRPPKNERPPHPGISITFQIPALRKPKKEAVNAQVNSNQNQRRMLVPVLLAAAALIIAGVVVFAPPTKHGPKPTSIVEAAARTAPDYQPLMLADQKPTTQNYDGKRNMVGFTTTFSGIRVTVSEQAIPANFAHDPTALMRTADSINAKQHVETARGTIFVASNEVAGDQMGVFADKQVLGFIHTDHKMDDASWKSFVEQLKPVEWSSNN